jgi:anti-sigma factor RsiW
MDDNDCTRMFALLSEYLDGELTPATRAEFEAHFSGCSDCITFLQTLKRSKQLCQQFGKSLACPPANDAAMARLRQAYQEMLAKRRAAK